MRRWHEIRFESERGIILGYFSEFVVLVLFKKTLESQFSKKFIELTQ